jgi:6-phosphogluconolactonase/glucosamine-6-phosphate isomerase/deaminase
VTLNPAILGAAAELLAVTVGSAKAAALGEIFGPGRDPSRWPAQLARRGGATWFIDEAAAARLPQDGVRA